jgi:hypothetical protein
MYVAWVKFLSQQYEAGLLHVKPSDHDGQGAEL